MRARRSLLLLVLFAVEVGLAGCQPLPRPFQPIDKSISIDNEAVQRNFSLFLKGVEGLDEDLEHFLLTRLGVAFADLGVPSSLTAYGKGSMSLWGYYSPSGGEGGKARILWEISDAAGEVIALFEQEYVLEEGAREELIQNAAARAYSLLIDIDRDVYSPKPLRTVVFLAPIDGAPGDGAEALASSMRASLSYLGIDVVAALGSDLMSILGSVRTTKIGRQEVIEINWSLIQHDGDEIGLLTQENTVASGSLDGSWGEVAYLIAEAAAPGLALLIKEYSEALQLAP